jgi:hypothetical protein
MVFFPSIPALFAGPRVLRDRQDPLHPGAQAHIGNLGEDRDLNLDFGWYGMANAIGQLLGPFAAGLVIDRAGFRRPGPP